MMNRSVHPVIPEKGSVGASGDLAPLAHLALALLGEGEVFFQGRRMPSSEALRLAKLKPVQLEAKEGLALLNGTQAMRPARQRMAQRKTRFGWRASSKNTA